MNTDFRISVSAVSHPKVIKLMRRCGDVAFYNLVQLWTFTALNKPDGRLTGMDMDDVEIAAKWQGAPGELHAALIDLRLLDVNDDGCVSIHDWDEHNGYASYAQQRSEQARDAANIRWNKKRGNATHDAGGCAHDAAHDAESCSSNAPAPSPAPSPSPSPAPYSGTDCCAESAQAPPAAPPVSAEPAVLIFPLAKRGEEYPVTQADVDEWAGSYPGIDVMQELRNCCQWNRDNPTRRKTKTGIRKHISGWLAKAQNQGGRGDRASPQQRASPQYPQRLTARQAYMMEVGNYLKGQGYGSSIIEQPNDTPRTDPAPRALPGGGP